MSNVEKNTTVVKRALGELFGPNIHLIDCGDVLMATNEITVFGRDVEYNILISVKRPFIITSVRFELGLVKEDKNKIELIKFINYLNSADLGRALVFTNNMIMAMHKIFTPNEEVASVEAVKYSLACGVSVIEDNMINFISISSGINTADELIAKMKKEK